MNEFETTIHLMMLKNVSYDELAKRLGHRNAGNLYNTLNKNKDIYVSSLKKILDALGYDIVFREKGTSTGGYVVSDDGEISSLRFHDMNLDFDIIFGDKPDIRKKKLPRFTVGEANLASEALKKKIIELSFDECDRKLREIWGIEECHGKRKPKNEYMEEYQRYRDELLLLYGKG